MQAPLLHKIQENNFWLTPERCIYWEQQNALIISDVHFGKTGHFRKAGIAVPQTVFKEDLQRLLDVIKFFNAQKLFIVGDLFHSGANLELELFKRWRNDIASLYVYLIKGNHDILQKQWYADADIALTKDELLIGSICFTHNKCKQHEYFTFCGHLHPGIVMHGLGKQSLRFPCFYFSNEHCILPAFSKFTGLTKIEPNRKDSVYAIVENKLLKVQ
ncbi:MAG: ligase-associated DNA damage response endonuclease PdeM [Chitinophagaceae bacterium]|nr:ligase-associated DNA damage response endonuclease PdeM [Chitinophagaceae bacterium]